MNPTCEFVRPRLSRYLDGALPPEEAARVEEHLATCAGCTAALASLRLADRVAREAAGEEESGSFEALRRAMRERFFVGPIDAVARNLRAIAAEAQADELMVLCNVHDHEKRKHVYTLLARALA